MFNKESEVFSFNQDNKELKDNFEIVDNFITEENVNSNFKYDFIPTKMDSHLINSSVNDLETHKTDRAKPYCISFYRSSKLAGRYNRDLTPYEIDKCKKETLTFDGSKFVSRALDFCLKLKREEKRTSLNKENVECHAQNGSGFDTWNILYNFPCDKHIADIIKNGKGIISLKILFGDFERNKKQKPQNLIFSCGMTHLKCCSKKLGKTFKKNC